MTGLKKRDGLPCLVFNVLVANIALNTAMLLKRIFTRDKRQFLVADQQNSLGSLGAEVYANQPAMSTLLIENSQQFMPWHS